VIVLDASVLIGHLDSVDAHHPGATRLLVGVAAEQLAVSPLTLAEVLVAPTRMGRLAAAQTALGQLDLVTVPWDAEAPARLAALRVDTGLRLPDCCVLLAAQSGTSPVATFDGRLAAAARALGHVALP
jgi:predicted nucleic acid-binding protein